MLCPDGCGERIVLNLDPRAGPAWRLYDRKEKTTLYPSVWRRLRLPQPLHTLEERDTLVGWFSMSQLFEIDRKLLSAVRKALSSDRFLHFRSLADFLGEDLMGRFLRLVAS